MTIFGWISMGLFSIVYIPQLCRTWRTKNVEGISLSTWIIQAVAFLTGFIYSVSLSALPLALNYLLGLFYTTLFIQMYFMFRDPEIEQTKRIIREVLREARKKKNSD